MSDLSVPQASGGQAPKSNKIVLILVAVVVIAVLIYAFVGQSEDATPASTTPITQQQQLLGEWNRTDQNGDLHYLIFEQDGTFIYTVTPKGNTSPTIAAIRTDYTLKDGQITVNYTIDMEAFQESYTVCLSDKNLVIASAKEGSTRLAGTFTPAGQTEDQSAVSGTTTSPTTSSVPNSQPTASSTPTVSATTPPASSTTLTNAVEAYLRYLNTRTNYPDGKLLYLDNDEIPELYLIGACEADGSYLVTFANGKICERSFGRLGGLTYVEKSGKYQYYNGHMGYYHLEQGTLSGGAFQITTTGIAEESYDDASYSTYTLNGSVVDSLAFEKQLSDWLRGGYILYGYENSVPRQTLVAQLSNLL